MHSPPLKTPAIALMAELVDALVSGTSDESRGGSSPLQGTKSQNNDVLYRPTTSQENPILRVFFVCRKNTSNVALIDLLASSLFVGIFVGIDSLKKWSLRKMGCQENAAH